MTEDKMREAFEAWFASSRRSRGAGKQPTFARLPDDTYADDHTQRHWWTWQCSAASQAQEMEALRADAARYRWLRSITIHEWHRMANYTGDALDAEVDFRNPAVRMEKP